MRNTPSTSGMTASSKASSCARKLAHAQITELDLAPARAISGVGAVISLLADDRMVRYVGEPIAAVAAKDRKTALAAIAAIKVDSERLPAVIGLDAARKPDAPVVFENPPQEGRQRVGGRRRAGVLERQCPRAVGGVLAEGRKRRAAGSPGAREARNPLLVEETFRTGTQSHACLEPHATVARFDGDRLTVHVSTQAVFHVMELIAKRYKLAHDKIRVIADHVGGGFGSKGALGIETISGDRSRARGQGAGADRL